MRIAAMVFAVLGAVLSGLLGMKWLGDANNAQAALEAARSLGVDTAPMDTIVRAAYALLGSLALGIAGCVLVFKRQGKPAAGALAAGVVLPALFAMNTLLTTSFLGIGAVFALFSKPKQI